MFFFFFILFHWQIYLSNYFALDYDSGDHIEVISVDYDPEKINFAGLLDLFWNNHEYGLTTRVKRQYSSVIFYHNDTQKEIALKSLENESLKRNDDVIITEVRKCEIVYAAEE